MAYPNNYKYYPENVYAPREIELSDELYTLYSYHFKGLHDLYDFLKKDPAINYEIWCNDEISSVSGSYQFAGESYNKALEKLLEDMDPGYQEYLKVQKNMRGKMMKVHNYQSIKSVAGGLIDPVAYTTGSPTIYRTSRLITKPKFLTIDIQVAYYHGTTKKQVFNRALIITNLIRALERQGYNVDVNSFMVAEQHNEIIEVIFEIKQHGGLINYQALYKSLVDVEFFRRLCFRLIEISDVKTYWARSYGRTCDEELVRELLKLKKEDIYFDQPTEMGICGYDIGDDLADAVKHLNLEKLIDIPREQKVLRESLKVLKK